MYQRPLEQQLYECEMQIVELELRLLMAINNQERGNQQTPKMQKRSLLNGNTNLSSTRNTLISSPTSKFFIKFFKTIVFF
jgi:hypothetical protein